MEASGDIQPYTEGDFDAFKRLFHTYFMKDFAIELTEEQANDLCADICRQAEGEIIFLDLLRYRGATIGFIIYQIDSKKSDWCEKEGYGFIREIYVSHDFRGHGFGRGLVSHAEQKLRLRSVPGIYLTSDDSGFWGKMGYRNSGAVSPGNQEPIYLK